MLALVVGIFGGHRFYVGKTGTAMVMLILGVLGLFGLLILPRITIVPAWLGWIVSIAITAVVIWALVDLAFILTGYYRDRGGGVVLR